jgi:glycosyltransferase involved in cell wall biosynthesis
VSDRVEFTGRVSEERKLELLSRCKVFVMPSLFESYGLAVAEAMAWGKPVVASRVGGLPEVVGNAGIMVPPKDSTALASSLNKLLSDDDDRRVRGKRGREHIRRYSWDRVVDDLEIVYRKVAEE